MFHGESLQESSYKLPWSHCREALKGSDYSNAVRKLLSIVDCYDNIDLVEGTNSLELLPRELSRFVKITSIRGKESADLHGSRSSFLCRSGK